MIPDHFRELCGHCGAALWYHCGDSSGKWCPANPGRMDYDKTNGSQFWPTGKFGTEEEIEAQRK